MNRFLGSYLSFEWPNLNCWLNDPAHNILMTLERGENFWRMLLRVCHKNVFLIKLPIVLLEALRRCDPHLQISNVIDISRRSGSVVIRIWVHHCPLVLIEFMLIYSFNSGAQLFWLINVREKKQI